MFWAVFAVVFILAGVLIWAVRSGRAPESVRRCLSWWFYVDDQPVEPVWEAEPIVQETRMVEPAVPEPETEPVVQQETAPVVRPARVVSPAPVHRAPVQSADDLPEIRLADVALNLQERRYRVHPPVRHEADPVLPVLDGQAIRDNLKRRMPSAASALPEEAELPVIGSDEVEKNLQLLAGRERAPRPSVAESLPVIDADEVRASLEQIHGNRLRRRASRTQPPELAEPRPSAPVAEHPMPAPSPLLKSTVSETVPAAFVPLPASRVVEPVRTSREPQVPLGLTPVVRTGLQSPVVEIPTVQAEPLPQPSSPSSLPSEPQVPAPRVHAPNIQPEVVAVTPVMPVMATPSMPPQNEAVIEASVSPEPDWHSEPVAPAVSASSLVWHSIEERGTAAGDLPQASTATPEPADDEPGSFTGPADMAVAATDAVVPAVREVRLPYDRSCLPSLDLLKPADPQQVSCPEDVLLERGIVIEEKLAEFKVKVSVVDAYAGPVITRFEVEPAVGVRGSQVVNLIKDLARALGLASIRVVETIPGKTCMGLELPNPVRQMIRLSEIFSSPEFMDPSPKLTLALGKDITGEPVVMDLARAPHLLVAGTTGSGKSVGVNAMILSLLYRFTPDEVRFIMIDPKMLELSVYNDIPHLLAPVVTDMKLAANALNWCVGEMEKRYRLMSALGVRNLAGYNEKVRAAQLAGSKLTNPFSVTPDDPEPLEVLPAIVVVVDEFADLMMVAGKKIEELIARLAQKARAAGLHLILATQRPSVDVITGLIKANIPTRIAFQVSSKVDSRTILDQMGAEALLGQGDMLYLPPGSGYPQRIHGAFVADDEVHAVVQVLKQFGEPDYVEGLLTGESELDEDATAGGSASAGGESDPLYDEAVEIVLRTRRASISSVQRHLRIGYNRAARLIEEMEVAGLVSSMESNGSRSVLVPQRDA